MQLLALTLVAWTHAGWGLFLRLAVPRGWGRAASAPPAASAPSPIVSVVVAAYAEEAVIAGTVRALLAQDHVCEVVVACDGSPDATAQRARAAGAHVVLELPRGGKHAAQAAAVARAGGSLLAFCDANTTWEPGALTALVAVFDDSMVGYACGHVSFVRAGDAAAPNQEGAYWALELATRRLESSWHSVTAGNGGIYALRAELWPQLRTDLGHDLALPHQVVRRGLLAVDVPGARARELMVPSLEGEWRRKRRMMARMWGIVARDPRAGGLLDPRGLPPRYLLALASHRWLRYASPGLHVVALSVGVASVIRGRAGRVDRALLAAQLAVLAGAAAPSPAPRGAAPLAPSDAPSGAAPLGTPHGAAPLGTPASSPAPGGAAAPSPAPPGSKTEPDRTSVRRRLRARPFLLCRYYVLMTASIAAGGLDRLRDGAPTAGWAPAEGTR